MLYHTTESAFYGRTKAEVWFASTEAAEAAGFKAQAPTKRGADEETATDEEAAT